ncbi:MAG: hypothetical protein KatS3mg081_1900 [Gemmatimonadales bacterium]|nr:MAG: hypothetical protein KatS3mg081_1900 [Gemmatimonadales bacterium]
MRCARLLFWLAAAVTPAAGYAQLVGHTTELSRRAVTVRLEWADGRSTEIVAGEGRLELNGETAARYTAGGMLEQRLRALVSRSAELESEALLTALRQMPTDGFGPRELEAWNRFLAALPAGEAAETLPPPDPSLYQPLEESGAPLTRVFQSGSERATGRGVEVQEVPAVERVATGLLTVLGGLVALAALGFGALFFVPDRVETVAQTVAHSPFRCFLAGLCTQPLILPALATLLIALVLTVVGILLIPVAVVLFVLGLAAAVIGGYLAVARVVGEMYARRKGWAEQYTGGWTVFRYLAYGLIGLLAIWVPAALLGWIPVLGAAFVLVAGVFTWIMATAGLGAVVLSRAGTRTTFAATGSALPRGADLWREPLPKADAST